MAQRMRMGPGSKRIMPGRLRLSAKGELARCTALTIRWALDFSGDTARSREFLRHLLGTIPTI